MKLYISADIEGVTGVTSWNFQCGSPGDNNPDWQFARRMMTHDVNAAIRGAGEAGATKIVVKDSHNVGKNLLIEELICPTGVQVELISGSRASINGMMDGISDEFDAAFLVGYHAMAGTAEGVMEHTISGRIHRCWLNDQEIGEQSISALTAAAYGVPLCLVTSDDKGCREAKTLFPGVQTCTTKFGMGRHIARLLHPNVTGPAIQQAAKSALEALPSPLSLPNEFNLQIEFNRSEECDEASLIPGWNRVNAYQISASFTTWALAHQSLRRAMSAAGHATT